MNAPDSGPRPLHGILRRIDLNLLVTLDTLLRERHVTRTAQVLNLAQPTVSMQLARLRELLDDPLLLPGPQGMQSTARAEQLRIPLHDALHALGQAVAPPEPFNPATAHHTWRLVATDYTLMTVLQPILPRLREQAPGMRLAIHQLSPPLLSQRARQDDFDLAFHITAEAPPHLRRRSLFHERYVLAARAGHPVLKRRPTLAKFCRQEHAIVSPDGGGFQGATDRALAAVGLQRNVVLSVPHFLSLLHVLASTDLVAMVPERLAGNHPGVGVVSAPLEIPGFEMLMLWPERLHRDPAHQWLRSLVSERFRNEPSE